MKLNNLSLDLFIPWRQCSPWFFWASWCHYSSGFHLHLDMWRWIGSALCTSNYWTCCWLPFLRFWSLLMSVHHLVIFKHKCALVRAMLGLPLALKVLIITPPSALKLTGSVNLWVPFNVNTRSKKLAFSQMCQNTTKSGLKQISVCVFTRSIRLALNWSYNPTFQYLLLQCP